MVQINARFAKPATVSQLASVSSRIASLEKQILEAKREQRKAKKQVRKNSRIRAEFNALPQIHLHRSHGWVTVLERLQIYYFAKNGIPVPEVAAKFDVSGPTVYKYKNSGGI